MQSPNALANIVKARQMVSRRIDKLGMPIDPGILDTVTILYLHGINTVSSCEGHVDRVTGGPYVMFEAPGVKKYVEAFRAIPDRLSPEYKSLFKQASKANAYEMQKVLNLLDGFYKTRSVPNAQRIIVRCFGPIEGKLMCQGADLAHIMNKEKRQDLLNKNRCEMQAFTVYLEEIYLSHKSEAPSRRIERTRRGNAVRY